MGYKSNIEDSCFLDLIHHLNESLVFAIGIAANPDGLSVGSACVGNLRCFDDALHLFTELGEGVGFSTDRDDSFLGDVHDDFVGNPGGFSPLG